MLLNNKLHIKAGARRSPYGHASEVKSFSRLSWPARGPARPLGRAAIVVQANMMTKLFGGKEEGKASAPSARLQSSAAFNDAAPSWPELKALVEAKQMALGVNFLNPDLEAGPTHAAALKRTFGKSEPIRVKLYRDHASWCPYCHKVWLQLEEKQIPYTIEKINMRAYGDKPPSFLAKVPGGLLPALELDGRMVTESNVIMALLEDTFPYSPLRPPKGTPERQRADGLMRLERRLFSDWMGWLTSDWQDARNRAAFKATLDMVEHELTAAGGPYFLGSQLSLVDVTFSSMLERMAASLAYYKGYYLRGKGIWPAVERWFDAMESRPTYLATRSDHYTHCHDLPPQLGGCAMVPEGQPVAAQLDGGSWRLPLAPLSATSMPEPYFPGDSPARDTLEAAAKLVGNHASIVRFSLRGPGQRGPRPVMARLADPTAIPALEYTRDADAALRHVSHALLVGVDAKQVSQQALQVSPSASSPEAACAAPVISAAEYLRERVGVPRDMAFPAARQLRAHLTWLIDTLATA